MLSTTLQSKNAMALFSKTRPLSVRDGFAPGMEASSLATNFSMSCPLFMPKCSKYSSDVDSSSTETQNRFEAAIVSCVHEPLMHATLTCRGFDAAWMAVFTMQALSRPSACEASKNSP